MGSSTARKDAAAGAGVAELGVPCHRGGARKRMPGTGEPVGRSGQAASLSPWLAAHGGQRQAAHGGQRQAAHGSRRQAVPRGMSLGVCLTALTAAAATVGAGLAAPPRGGAYQPGLHIVLDTSGSLVALLAAFLAAGRLRRTLPHSLTLACGLMLLALSNLFFITLPTIFTTVRPDSSATWAWLAGTAAGSLLFSIAALAPARRMVPRGRPPLAGAAGLTAAALLIAGLVVTLAVRLPHGRATSLAALLGGQPAQAGVHLLIAALYALAVAGFLARSEELGDEFCGWLAIAAVLASASHADYLLRAALPEWGYIAEAFRLCFYAVLLLGSIREIVSYWRALSQAAVVEERQRIARDLHDGMAQELAYLARNLDALGPGADAETVQRLQRAVERAQLESRRAIRALAAGSRQPLPTALAEAAGEIAERFHVQLEPDLAADAQLPPVLEEALIRIACEAVANAARHSGAGRVRVSLSNDGQQVRLRVCDRGCGFRTEVNGRGFGLVSMRERARAVGADLRISSAPGQGTEVEVAV